MSDCILLSLQIWVRELYSIYKTVFQPIWVGFWSRVSKKSIQLKVLKENVWSEMSCKVTPRLRWKLRAQATVHVQSQPRVAPGWCAGWWVPTPVPRPVG